MPDETKVIKKYLTYEGLQKYDELIKSYVNNNDSGAVTITTATEATAGQFKTYVFTQKGSEIGRIDIPKDLVVQSGAVETYTAGSLPAGVSEAGTYIKLTIANQVEPLYINTTTLVDVYTAQEGATQVQVKIENYEVSATIVAGAINTTELADSAVTTAKIAVGAVDAGKLANGAVTASAVANGAISREKIDSNFETQISDLEAFMANSITDSEIIALFTPESE